MNVHGQATPATARRKAALLAASGISRPPVHAAPDDIGKGRRGRKGVVVYLHPIAKDLLADIGRRQRKTIQDLGIEAMNLLFKQYGEKPIA
jgi:hypothetical protein